jgi:hypothetical protein
LGFRVRKFEFFFLIDFIFEAQNHTRTWQAIDTWYPQVKLSGRDPSAHQCVLNPQPFWGPRVPDKGCNHLAITPGVDWMFELGSWRLNSEAYNDFFYFLLCYVELLCGHFFPKGFEINCWSKLPATHRP